MAKPQQTSKPYRLYASRGAGSMIAEAALELAGAPYEIEELDYSLVGPGKALKDLNPLGQVPVLILPDGTVMTESAAMVLYLADIAPEAGLAPAPLSVNRARFLRFLQMIVCAIYPTFTYGDEPTRWIGDQEKADEMSLATDRHRESLWLYIEDQIAPAPWFLGDEFSALDLYVWVMNRWGPRTKWFAARCPKLSSIAEATMAREDLAKVRVRNYG